MAVEVFEGNTSDPQTIREQIDKIKRRFKLSHVALVGDRGMVTSARISEELAPAGLDWISCLRAPQIAALASDTGPLQLSLFDERDLAEITSPDFPGELRSTQAFNQHSTVSLLLAWLFRQGVPPHVTYLFKQASSRIARSTDNA